MKPNRKKFTHKFTDEEFNRHLDSIQAIASVRGAQAEREKILNADSKTKTQALVALVEAVSKALNSVAAILDESHGLLR